MSLLDCARRSSPINRTSMVASADGLRRVMAPAICASRNRRLVRMARVVRRKAGRRTAWRRPIPAGEVEPPLPHRNRCPRATPPLDLCHLSHCCNSTRCERASCFPGGPRRLSIWRMQLPGAVATNESRRVLRPCRAARPRRHNQPRAFCRRNDEARSPTSQRCRSVALVCGWFRLAVKRDMNPGGSDGAWSE